MKRFSASARSILSVVAILGLTLTAAVSLSAAQPQDPGRSPKHIATPEEARAAALAASDVRTANLKQLESFLDSAAVRDQIAGWGIGAGLLRQGLGRLDDSELASLASRAGEVTAGLEGAGYGISKTMYYTVIAILLAMVLIALLI